MVSHVSLNVNLFFERLERVSLALMFDVTVKA